MTYVRWQMHERMRRGWTRWIATRFLVRLTVANETPSLSSLFVCIVPSIIQRCYSAPTSTHRCFRLLARTKHTLILLLENHSIHISLYIHIQSPWWSKLSSSLPLPLPLLLPLPAGVFPERISSRVESVNSVGLVDSVCWEKGLERRPSKVPDQTTSHCSAPSEIWSDGIR